MKQFDLSKRFGFIGTTSGDIFVHLSDVKDGTLRESQEVEFEVVEGTRGPKAINVTLVNARAQ